MPFLRINNHNISTPLLDIVKIIQQNLHNGKLAVVKPNGDNIRVSCVNSNHKGGREQKPSADIYIGPDVEDIVSYGTYSCFTCGITCSFEHFVAMAFDQSDDWAKEWLVENFADSLVDDIPVSLPEIVLDCAKKQILNKSILDTFENFHPYMVKRKLSPKTIEEFDVKYDSKTKCLVFPVYDEQGDLTLLTRRSVEDKTFIIDKNKEKPLYLLYYIRQKNISKAMICEGQIDALTSFEYGMPCVATIGAISDHQIELLNKSGIRTLYVMFDNDEAGYRFREKLLKNLRKDILTIPVDIVVPNRKDINDLSRDEFWYCVESAEKNCIMI